MMVKYKQQGFTLLEIIISMTIFSIGLLAIAGLHIVSIEHVHAAYLRSQAIHISQDISERMRNNLAAVNTQLFDNIDSSTITSLAPTGCLTSTIGCSIGEIAAIELSQWVQSIRAINSSNRHQQLPSAQASIKKASSDINLFIIKVQWQHKQWSTTDTGAFHRAKATTNYQFKIIVN